MKSQRITALLASIALAFTVSAQAASYSGLFVFGDSLSDSGNNALVPGLGIDTGQVIGNNQYFASSPYASGTYSNGPVWAQGFAAQLGLQALPSLAGGGDYAFGGAQTGQPGSGPGGFPPSLTSQVGLFVSDHGGVADAGALYVVAGGGPNVVNAMTQVLGGADPVLAINTVASQFAADMGTIVDHLQAAGAQHIVVWNTPNFGLTPLAASYGALGTSFATSLSAAMNVALAQRLAGEPADVLTFDAYGLLTTAVANSASFGFSNVTDACGAASSGCDPATALFYDAIHPTALGHQVLANAMFALAVPEPSSGALLLLGIGLVGLTTRRQLNRPTKTPTP